MHWLEQYYGGGVGDLDINQGDNRFFTNSWNSIANYLVTAGVPKTVLPFAVAQVMVETGALKTNVSKTDLNLSGITYINKPYQKATKGTPRPEGGYYAKYASYSDWARDMKRILSLNGAKAPINATNAGDYVQRLYANHYFTSSPASYLSLLNNYIAKAQALNIQMAQGIKKGEADFKAQHKAYMDQFKPPNWVIWLGAGVAGLIIVNNITSR